MEISFFLLILTVVIVINDYRPVPVGTVGLPLPQASMQRSNNKTERSGFQELLRIFRFGPPGSIRCRMRFGVVFGLLAECQVTSVFIGKQWRPQEALHVENEPGVRTATRTDEGLA